MIRNSERMDDSQKIFRRLVLPLCFWGSLIAVLFVFLPSVPQEPEGLSPETWSYYGSHTPPRTQLLKFRNEIIIAFVFCAFVSEFLFFYVGSKRQKKIS